MSFLLEGAWRKVVRGGVVFMPKNAVRTLENVSYTPQSDAIETMPTT